MPLVFGVSKPLALENMSQMPATVVAHDLGPHHAQTGIRSLANGVGHGVPKGWPAAARVELVVGFVEGRIAASACVDAGIGVVLVVGARARHLGALLAEDAELFYRSVSGDAMRGEM